MQQPDILLRDLDDNGILRLTLNDPKRRNALSEEMLSVLAKAFTVAGGRSIGASCRLGRKRSGLLRGA